LDVYIIVEEKMKIKRIPVWIGIAILLVLFASSCGQCPECVECTPCPERGECPPCECYCCSGCVDFNGFQVGTNFGDAFELEGLSFISMSGWTFEVMEMDGENFLRLPIEETWIYLPCPASKVTLTVGSWAGGAITIEAIDEDQVVIFEERAQGDNSFHTVTLEGKGIWAVKITYDGDNEGALKEICVVYEEPFIPFEK
jgi:hypothetical protein